MEKEGLPRGVLGVRLLEGGSKKEKNFKAMLL